MKVLNSLNFIKKVKPMSVSVAKLWDELKVSAEEVCLHKQGKLKLKSAKDFWMKYNIIATHGFEKEIKRSQILTILAQGTDDFPIQSCSCKSYRT